MRGHTAPPDAPIAPAPASTGPQTPQAASGRARTRGCAPTLDPTGDAATAAASAAVGDDAAANETHLKFWRRPPRPPAALPKGIQKRATLTSGASGTDVGRKPVA